MTLYSVFEHGAPRRGADLAPPVVPEKFSWLAALLPLVFLLFHGLWLALLGYVLVLIVLYFAAGFLGWGAVLWLYLLFAVYLGFEAHQLRRGALRRRGFRHRAELIAPAADLAQLTWLQRSRVVR
ncbi:MAG TPA: DUF2628 domain-containing protein [Devosiaceae bacterium]|nr:DUF2628 domain-containing protein [Devosiaceae bacterium]